MSGNMDASGRAVLEAPPAVADTLVGGADMDHGSPRAARYGTKHGTPLAERFWAKVQRGPGCWLWLASTSTSGYGRILITRQPRQILAQAHRVSWEIHNGAIPPGLSVLHHCDTPPCVRPDHLFLGTQLDNIADMHAKGRQSGGSTPRPGELNPNAKLTADIVREIRKARLDGTTVREAAERFGISPAQVSRICTGKRWRHVA